VDTFVINPRRNITAEAWQELIRLHDLGYGATRTHRELEKHPEVGDQFEGEAGRQRVQRIFKEDLRPKKRDNSGPWSFAESQDPESARHVLDVLAYLIRETGDRTKTISNLEAAWIVRVKRAYPELPPERVWNVAKLYIRVTNQFESTIWIDRWLAAGQLHEPPTITSGELYSRIEPWLQHEMERRGLSTIEELERELEAEAKRDG
jgi:hypothetical protein